MGVRRVRVNGEEIIIPEMAKASDVKEKAGIPRDRRLVAIGPRSNQLVPDNRQVPEDADDFMDAPVHEFGIR